MALSKTPVSRQAPRPRPASPQPVRQVTLSVEDDGFEEVEEPAPVAPVPLAPRIFVDGLPCRRLQIDFGAPTTGFNPTGAVQERFWDQYDGDPDKDKYSRPRVFGNAVIKVNLVKGFLDFTATWADSTLVTRIVHPTATLSYEPL